MNNFIPNKMKKFNPRVPPWLTWLTIKITKDMAIWTKTGLGQKHFARSAVMMLKGKKRLSKNTW